MPSNILEQAVGYCKGAGIAPGKFMPEDLRGVTYERCGTKVRVEAVNVDINRTCNRVRVDLHRECANVLAEIVCEAVR